MKKLKYNTVASLLLQMVTIICGFILPRLSIQYYGSEVYGLVSSITQFLSVITFLELGVGAVIQSALYKPLVNKDTLSISKIVSSADKFFRKIALILVIYILTLIIFYPRIVGENLDFAATAILIISMGISYVLQYYFGIVDRLILTADQLGYIHYSVQIVLLILNTVLSALLIKNGYPIHIVKLVTAGIYAVRPIVLHWYIKKHYAIDRKTKYVGEPIAQKWNGMAQHVSAIVLDGTDNIVLTLFATLSDVSVYSVYYLVVYGIKRIFLSMTAGIHALIGELWAKQDLERLKKIFAMVEWTIHTGVTIIFGCTAFLVVPFVRIYTKSVRDADYIQPLFAVLFTAAHAGHCLRLPYNIMILAGGHYKRTQHNYIIAAVMNIVVSIALVKTCGLIGVAIGTLMAMTYQTVWMAWYNSRNLLKWEFRNFVKQFLVDVLIVCAATLVIWQIEIQAEHYVMWALEATKIFLIWCSISLIINSIFYRDMIKQCISKFLPIHRVKGDYV